MATQKCPRCSSDRIRLGYRPTSIFQKLMFRYNLLCNDCNWEFVGFAVPGTVSTKVKRKQKTSNGETNYPKNETLELAKEKDSNYEENESNSENENVETDFNSNENRNINKVKKRVRVKLS